MQVDIRIIETIIVTLACILKSYQGENLATSDTSKKKTLRNLKCRDILISHLEYEVILINCLKSDRENIYLLETNEKCFIDTHLWIIVLTQFAANENFFTCACSKQ